MPDDERIFDSHQEAIIAAIVSIAKEGGGSCVWVHQVGCLLENDDDDTCNCEPECIEVGITS